jgi:GWxTD domain-containing protein
MTAALPVALALIGIWPKFGDDPLEATFPLEAAGDIHFQVEAVLFREAGKPAVELDIALPQSGFEEPADSLDLSIRVGMLDREGGSLAAFVARMTVPPDTAQAGTAFPVPSRWVRLYPQWVPGTVALEIRVEDESALKRGLLDKLRGQHRYGEAAARLAVPGDGDPDSVWVSGLLFAWSQDASEGTGGPGLRGVRARLRPNPFRFYGLYQPVLTVYWERYPPPPALGLVPGDPLRLEYRIVELPAGTVVLESSEDAQVDAGARWELRRFDVSQLESGSYRLDAAILDPRFDTAIASTSGRFQVLWEEGRWLAGEYDLRAVARVLLSSAIYDSFVTLGRGEQEAFLRDFWNRHDPTAPGQPNLLEQRFHERLAIANARYTRYRPGMETDRGRVFIRYGEPDEITVNVNPQDEELIGHILPREIDDPGTSLEERLRRTRTRDRYDNRAYEIWDYQVRGDPLIPEYVHPGMETGLKFIFVDELGFGDYSLVYTSIVGGLQ